MCVCVCVSCTFALDIVGISLFEIAARPFHVLPSTASPWRNGELNRNDVTWPNLAELDLISTQDKKVEMKNVFPLKSSWWWNKNRTSKLFKVHLFFLYLKEKKTFQKTMFSRVLTIKFSISIDRPAWMVSLFHFFSSPASEFQSIPSERQEIGWLRNAVGVCHGRVRTMDNRFHLTFCLRLVLALPGWRSMSKVGLRSITGVILGQSCHPLPPPLLPRPTSTPELTLKAIFQHWIEKEEAAMIDCHGL